jgi:hypothetical protein
VRRVLLASDDVARGDRTLVVPADAVAVLEIG